MDDLDRAIAESHRASIEFVNGNPEPLRELYSDREDITLGNPFGPFVRGPAEVSTTLDGAAARYEDGEEFSAERVSHFVTDDLACVVEFERFRAKVGGRDEHSAIALRVTSVYRLEDVGWRLVHRHADPITAPQPSESIIGS